MIKKNSIYFFFYSFISLPITLACVGYDMIENSTEFPIFPPLL